jgi:AhpC/TSA family
MSITLIGNFEAISVLERCIMTKEIGTAMLRRLVTSSILIVVVLMGLSKGWAAKVGDPAPDFTATDSNGKVHKLSEYRGKFVVLEWSNRGCPYTQKQYNSGNMQRLQKEWTARGVIWLTVISSAPGKQGYVTASDENAYLKQVNASPTAVLLDPTGSLGHLYDAKTTPHMFIINPQGILIYNGAIDDRPTTDLADVNGAKNYVTVALTEATSGKPVSNPTSRPYGCSVKYPD